MNKNEYIPSFKFKYNVLQHIKNARILALPIENPGHACGALKQFKLHLI